MLNKQEMRRAMRQMRRALPAARQREAGEALARRLAEQTFFQHATHIAFYMPSDGEIDPTPAYELAHKNGKMLYLPVLDGSQEGHLLFVAWRPGDPLESNIYGIPEPGYGENDAVPPSMLDLVCLPLVAFDASGNRLGMGGGYYDRTFAQQKASISSKPLLVGFAHHFQQAEHLPCDTWDVPLYAVVTDQDVILMPQTLS